MRAGLYPRAHVVVALPIEKILFICNGREQVYRHCPKVKMQWTHLSWEVCKVKICQSHNAKSVVLVLRHVQCMVLRCEYFSTCEREDCYIIKHT